MKRFYLLSALFLFSIATFAQNQSWTLPGSFLDLTDPNFPTLNTLPTDINGDPDEVYIGQQSDYAHNVISKPNGTPWFFIMDGKIYEEDGFLIGDIHKQVDFPVQGLSEILIVPQPLGEGNCGCQKFYIFLQDMDAVSQRMSPYYGILDMCEQSDYNNEYFGSLVEFSNNKTAKLMDEVYPIGVPPFKWGNCMFASTDEIDSKRFIFVSGPRKMHKYRLDTQGLTFEGSVFDIDDFEGNISPDLQVTRSELEVVKLSSGFRIAVPFGQPEATILIMDLDNSGNAISSTKKIIDLSSGTNNSGDRAYLHGLEFSPSGDYLYFTHSTNTLNPNPMEYFNVNTEVRTAITATGASDFFNSEIELALDGKLYFATADRLATFSNPDNPGSGTWTNNAVSFGSYTYNKSTAGLPDDAGNNYQSGLYLLPDQIDGMDYFNGIKTIDQVEYTATTSATWTPTNNPLNNNGGTVATIKNELRIKSGVTILVKDMIIKFEPGAELVIESTGWLRLRNTTLTNNCDDFWEGVKVKGSTSATQTTAYQGRLMMQSGSSIENALIGVSTEVDGLSQSGGIITASSSDFINNVQDVVFMKHPGNNISYFSGCEFKTTENYLGDYTTQVPTHVTLNEVDNVSFSNADFLEGRNGLNINTQGATGILGSLSSFEVKSGSDFTGLKNGIRAFGQINATYQVLIDNSVFYNRYNIYLEDFTGAEVLENYITVDPDDPISGQYQKYPYGIYLQHCFDYQVEENKLFSSSDRATIGQSLGIVVRNNHEQSEEIYLNEFTMFSVAIEPLDQNRSDNPKDNFQGLQIRCNEFNNCMWDISVLPGDSPPFGVLLGIAYEQGRPTSGQIGTEDLGGNLFTVQNYSSLAFNYYNHYDMEYVVYELHNNYVQYPRIYPWEFFNNDNFDPNINGSIAYDPLLSCPSNINGGGGSSSDLLVLKNSSQTEYETSSAVLNSEVDGGNTTQMEGVVATTTEQTAWNNYQILMDEQGYLSNEVLEDVGEKEDGLSNAMIRNVLVANPASAKSNEVQEKLDNRLDPLPDYMRYQIDQGINQISAREAMEQLVSGHRYNRDKAIKKGVHLVLSDTLLSDNEKKTQMLEFYANTGDKNHEIKIAMLHDRFGETQLADEIYESLLFEFQGTAFGTELEEYLEYRTLISGWNSITNLNDDQLLLLDSYSLGGQMTASKARGLLVLNGAEVEPEPTVMPEEGDKSFNGEENKKWDSSFDNTMMLVYPNPTEHFVTLRYTVAETFNQLVVVVLDVKGNAVWSKKLHYDQDEIIIKMENLPAGNYYIQLLKDGQTLKTEKVTLVK